MSAKSLLGTQVIDLAGHIFFFLIVIITIIVMIILVNIIIIIIFHVMSANFKEGSAPLKLKPRGHIVRHTFQSSNHCFQHNFVQ